MQVLTPVRRSARKQLPQMPVTSLLYETDFSYAPNPMHAPAPEQSPRADDDAGSSDTTEAGGEQEGLSMVDTAADEDICDPPRMEVSSILRRVSPATAKLVAM